jgi:hypothetical protein
VTSTRAGSRSRIAAATSFVPFRSAYAAWPATWRTRSGGALVEAVRVLPPFGRDRVGDEAGNGTSGEPGDLLGAPRRREPHLRRLGGFLGAVQLRVRVQHRRHAVLAGEVVEPGVVRRFDHVADVYEIEEGAEDPDVEGVVARPVGVELVESVEAVPVIREALPVHAGVDAEDGGRVEMAGRFPRLDPDAAVLTTGDDADPHRSLSIPSAAFDAVRSVHARMMR